MTGIVIALPILLAVLAQSADRGKEPQLAPAPGQSQASPATAAPSIPGEKAFNRLFTMPAPPQNQDQYAIVAVPDQKPAAKVVCGMVVIQADPNVDPRFVIRAPADTSGFKIRRIAPPACAD